MEVHFTFEQEAQLAQIAVIEGTAPSDLVKMPRCDCSMGLAAFTNGYCYDAHGNRAVLQRVGSSPVVPQVVRCGGVVEMVTVRLRFSAASWRAELVV